MTTIVRTAGMVNGTPDWQLDRMYEAKSARMWEEQNARDKAWDRMIEACGYLNVVGEHLDKALTSLIGAKDEVEGLDCEWKIGSIMDSCEELMCEVEKIRQQFIHGEGV